MEKQKNLPSIQQQDIPSAAPAPNHQTRPTQSRRQSPRLTYSPDLPLLQPLAAPSGYSQEIDDAQTADPSAPAIPRRQSPRLAILTRSTEVQTGSPPVVQENEEDQESLTIPLSTLHLGSQSEVDQSEDPVTVSTSL